MPPIIEDTPSHTDFQYLENLSTAYWYSEILFAAIELQLFDLLEIENTTTRTLAETAGYQQHELGRLLDVLKTIKLVEYHDPYWSNNQIAKLFLLTSSNSYMGGYFLYRRYMQPNWQSIAQRISQDTCKTSQLSQNDDYKKRNYYYVAAQDSLVLQKSPELVEIINSQAWHGSVLDIGGGAGSLLRAIINSKQEDMKTSGTLIDLKEVIEAAREIFPNDNSWKHISTLAGDFRSFDFQDKRFGLILISNFLHTYGREQAKKLLEKATQLLTGHGIIVVHDYFPDRSGRSPHKGSLYDLNMMLNTYDGSCQTAQTITGWLDDCGLTKQIIQDLRTDSSVIIASRGEAI